MAMITACLIVTITSVFGQRRKCPLEMYSGNYAWGTTETFYVGDPFDGIGQIEVWRIGKTTDIHEKNRVWKMDGVRIKPGEVFTKTGKYIMYFESNGYETAYNIEILPANKPKRPVASVQSYPTKTEYKVGNRFQIEGIKVICHDDSGKEIPVEAKDLTFFTSISNTLVGAGTQSGGGFEFTIPGKKEIEIRYKYVTIGKYMINVAKDNSLTAILNNKPTNSKPTSTNHASSKPASTKSAKTKNMANGWYNLRAMNNYLNLDATGCAELRKKAANQAFYVENKGNNQVTLKMTNGKYLGIDNAIKDGVRVKAVSSPYLWNLYSENNADIYSLRPPTNIETVVNASEMKNTDGTHIILWTYTDLNAPNNAEFRFIPTKL